MIYLTLNVISSSNKYLLGAYWVPITVTGDGDSTEAKTDQIPVFKESILHLLVVCLLFSQAKRVSMLALLKADIQLGENKQ